MVGEEAGDVFGAVLRPRRFIGLDDQLRRLADRFLPLSL
jgi:hypothetical protein